jgi:GNAT superfamily N-acetyltransferase
MLAMLFRSADVLIQAARTSGSDMIDIRHELLKVARELTALSGLRLEQSNRGYHDNQSDDSIRAYIGDEMAGYIDYAEYQGEVHIQMISVRKKFRRQGIATAMLRELDRLYPDIEIDPGMTTPDGTKLLEEYQRRYPKRLDFEGGVSNRDFVLSLVPDFGKHGDKVEWHDIDYAMALAGIDLSSYDMSYEPNVKRFRKDIAKVSDVQWSKAAKQLRSDLSIRKNSDL